MTSIPVPFTVGSAMSTSSVRDVIASYRRAQYLIAGSTIAAATGSIPCEDEDEDEDEESGFGQFDEYEEDEYYSDYENEDEVPQDGFVDQLTWDEDLTPSDSTAADMVQRQVPASTPVSVPRIKRPTSMTGGDELALSPAQPASFGVLRGPQPRETTPLLSRKVSFNLQPQSLNRPPTTTNYGGQDHLHVDFQSSHKRQTSGGSVAKSFRSARSVKSTRVDLDFHSSHQRRTSGGSVAKSYRSARSAKSTRVDLDFHSSHQRRASGGSVAKSFRSTRSARPVHVGRSTFGQTLFNCVAVLLGIGMLSEPLAFAYSGWIMGTILIISYGALACYTAKILARVIRTDTRLRSYSDIGRKAFGPRATLVISFMFCMELFAVSVILVTLYADSLHTIIPTYSANTYKIWGLLVIVPTVFLPLSLLSYTSIIGILSIILLIVVIFVDGASKAKAPGSFWDPAETSIGIASTGKLGIAFGLFMAGFAGHAVVPSLARDMIDPSEFDAMINWAFIIATFIYALIGYAGYLMFGNSVSEEVSVDMLNTPGYNPLLNRAALWMLVLCPLSKFALNTQPLNATLEILLGLDTPISTPEHVAKNPNSIGASECRGGRVAIKQYLAIIQRVVVTCASVAVSIYIPEFSVMMAFLGSFSAFCISIVGPVAAKVKIEGKCGVLDGVIMLLGTVMAVWGTVAAFSNSD